MSTILIALVSFGVLGAVAGFLLHLASGRLAVERNERAQEICALLPGANCGGCGFAGCAAFAEALEEGKAEPKACHGMEEASYRAICALLGQPSEERVRRVARVFCTGGCHAKEKYDYQGIRDCRIAASLAGGNKLCPNGCCGMGNCERACEFGALTVRDGVAQVDETLCRGCGVCATACPKGLIEMVPYQKSATVRCRSREKAKAVMAFCERGCIACGKCKRVCEADAIEIVDLCAVIDPQRCTDCGKCREVCDRGCITANS